MIILSGTKEIKFCGVRQSLLSTCESETKYKKKINFLLVRAELFMRGSLCYVNSPLAFDKYTDWGAAMQLKKAISSVAFIFPRS